jgi:ribosomal protein L40E
MKICNRCNVKITDDSNICPLCKSKLFDLKENKKENENTYPFILGHLHRYSVAIKILLLISVTLSIISVIINFYTTRNIPWSLICIAVIIYCWFTTLYSIKKDINIASHLFVQTICLSIVSVIVDNVLGYIGWSVNIAIPLIILISNIAIFIVLITNYKRYIKYILYHLGIFVLSFTPIILYLLNVSTSFSLMLISTIISFLSFFSIIVFYGKDLQNELKKTFHF